MPVGDKYFNDMVDVLCEAIRSTDYGYPRTSWSDVYEKLVSRLGTMCNKFKVVSGWQNVCGKLCPLKTDPDHAHPWCPSNPRYKVAVVNFKYYRDRTLNPDWQTLAWCADVNEDYRGFLNDLLSGYYDMERDVKPPGTSMASPVYRIGETTETGPTGAVGATAIARGYVTDAILQPRAMPEEERTDPLTGLIITSPPTTGIQTQSSGEPDEDDRDADDHNNTDEEEDHDEEPNDDQWECEWCDSIFDTEEEYSEHIRGRHPVCPTCHNRYRNNTRLSEHIAATHAAPAPVAPTHVEGVMITGPIAPVDIADAPPTRNTATYSCPRCGRTYPNQEDLTRHLDAHAAAQRAIADNAEASLRHRAEVEETRNSQREEFLADARRRYTCPVCGDFFFNERSLRGHQLLDHPATGTGIAATGGVTTFTVTNNTNTN